MSSIFDDIFYINKKSNVNHENDSNEEMIEDAEFREIPNPSGRNASDVIEISYTDSSEDISSDDEVRNAIVLLLETQGKHAKYRKDTSTGRKYQHYNHLNHRKDRGGRHIPQQKDGYDKYRNNRRPWEKKNKKSDYMRQRIAEREEAFRIIQRYAKKKKNKKRGGLGDQSKKKKVKLRLKLSINTNIKIFIVFFLVLYLHQRNMLYIEMNSGDCLPRTLLHFKRNRLLKHCFKN
jgi:hypothetical protein